MDWSVIGIILSLAFIVILALRGWHIIVIAPLAVILVSIFSNINIMETLTGPYMKGFVNYAGKFYLIFLAGSMFGKFMEDGQAARSIANGILRVIGKESPLRVMLAVSIGHQANMGTFLTSDSITHFAQCFDQIRAG